MALSPEQHAAVDAYLTKNAGDDAPLVKAILTAGELSTGDPTAESLKGARGLMQLTPIALKDMGIDPETFNYDSPAESVKAGIGYVRLLREKYGLTNPLQIAAAYNAGPGAVQAAVKAGSFKGLPEETQQYIKRVGPALAQAAPPPPAAPTVVPTPAPAPTAAPVAAPVQEAGIVPPVDSSGVLAHAGSALVRGATGIADIVGGAASGPLGHVPSVTAAVDPYLAPHYTSLPGRMLEGGLETVPTAVMSGGGVVPLITQVAGGALGPAGGDLTEAMGIGRVPGTLAANLAPTLVTTGVRSLVARSAQRDAERQAIVAAKAGNEALTNATQDAEAGLGVATAGAQTAEQAAAAAVADAKQAVEKLISTQDPVQRAQMLREIVKKRGTDIVKLGTADWDNNLLDITDKLGVEVPLGKLGDVASQVESAAIARGLSRDAALAKAAKVKQMLTVVDPATSKAILDPATGEAVQRTSMSFRDAQALRSEIGGLFGRTKGATQHGVGNLYGALASEMDAVLPEPLKPAYELLRKSRTAQADLIENTYVSRILTKDPKKNVVAERYIVSLLDGDKWTPAKQQEVMAVVRAAGDEGKIVLADGLVRNAFNAATSKGGKFDSQDFVKSLYDPARYRGMTQALLPVEEQRTLRHVADIVGNAEQAREAAMNVLASAKAGSAAAAKAAKTLQTVPEMSESVLGLLVKGAAGGAVDVAVSHIPVVGPVAAVLLANGQGREALRILRSPANRGLLTRAGKTVLNSVDGHELLRQIVGGVVQSKIDEAQAQQAAAVRVPTPQPSRQ